MMIYIFASQYINNNHIAALWTIVYGYIVEGAQQTMRCVYFPFLWTVNARLYFILKFMRLWIVWVLQDTQNAV